MINSFLWVMCDTTTRVYENDLSQAPASSTIHEMGHALYEQGKHRNQVKVHPWQGNFFWHPAKASPDPRSAAIFAAVPKPFAAFPPAQLSNISRYCFDLFH
jgi:hypothetical protein